MAVPQLKYSVGNSASTTTSNSITDSDTAVPLTSDTNFSAKSGAGMVLLDEGAATEELAYATGKVGASLTTPLANRGLEGGSPQAHSSQISVKGILTAGMWNDLIDHIVTQHNDDGTHSNVTADSLELGGGGVTADGIIDDDTLATASATTLPSSESVKAYVDSRANTDGWISSSDTWVYASASTFTIAGVDRTSIFKPGTRLKFTQTSVKYATVVSSAFATDTTVTIAVNTDYTIANAAITSPYYSYQLSPQGYPDLFSWTTTPTWSNGPTSTTTVSKYRIEGKMCEVLIKVTGTANGSNSATEPRFTLPVDYFEATVYGNMLGHAKWSDQATFDEGATIIRTNASKAEVSAIFPTATRKPNLFTLAARYQYST